MAARIKELRDIQWECVILDEAQAIKNPLTNQTKAVKLLKSRMKIAMTGTPIENDLSNLWSLFDFLDKGLLGTSKEFREFTKGLGVHPEQYARLKSMVAPFMLRRVKTDKRIIADLPDKLETVDYVEMSKKQVVLYRKVCRRYGRQNSEFRRNRKKRACSRGSYEAETDLQPSGSVSGAAGIFRGGQRGSFRC